MSDLGNLDVRRADMRERLVKSIEQNRAALRRLSQQEAVDFRPFMTYDQQARAVYLYLVRPENLRKVATTEAAANRVLLDWGPDGDLVGVEVLLPGEQGTHVPVRAQESGGPVPPAPESQDLPVPGGEDRAGAGEGGALG